MTGQDAPIDLAAYFHRIGFTDAEAKPSLDTLRALHALHPQAIPFENLDVLLGRPVRLDLASLQQKLVAEQRGGFCFEHNTLFGSVLEALGFRVGSYAARVLWNHDMSLGMPPRTHMILLVDVDEQRYLTDVGFGGLTLSAPLLLQTNLEQTTPHGAFQVRDAAVESDTQFVGLPGFVLETQIKGDWKPVYRFDLDPQFEADYAVANHFMSTHPHSLFMQHLVAGRVTPGKRLGLLNHTLSIHDERQGTHKRHLANVEELRCVLTNEFKIRLPDALAELEAAIVKLPD
ncbi:arylamine N-acetyltransferase [Paraburkholderia sp. JHI869]|uniref:arylamine N-acetyltransferase family protein n=1 Tax=Paraburkholderia sp. JHI869 TaxID=3112959 RepID=UPI00318061C0